MDREAIWSAFQTLLVDKLKTPGFAKTVSRIPKSFDHISNRVEEQPAVYTAQTGETRLVEKGYPPIITTSADLIVYTNRGGTGNTIPSTSINQILDAVEKALDPDPWLTFQDLGGLVSHCRIGANTQIFLGLTGAQTVTVVPIDIVTGPESPHPYWFGDGSIWAVPSKSFDRQDQADVTPIKVGAIRGLTLSVDSLVNLTRVAAHLNPVQAQVRGIEIRGKIMAGVFDGKLLSQIAFGAQVQSGATLIQENEEGTVTSGTITVSPPNSGTWKADLGVSNQSDGQALKFTTGAPAQGEYAVSAGVYTFNAADEGVAMVLSYEYQESGGVSFAIPDGPGSASPEYRLYAQGGYNESKIAIRLDRVTMSRFAMPTSTEKFVAYDIEFVAMSTGVGGVGQISQV